MLRDEFRICHDGECVNRWRNRKFQGRICTMGRLARFATLASIAALLSAPAMAADFTLRIHTLVQSPHPYNDMAEYMKEELEERSDNRIAVRIFNAGQLGQDPAVI